MFVISNFLVAVAKVSDILLTVLYWLILIRALVSWVSPDPSNPIVQFLQRTTDPILNPIRRMLPPMAFDLSLIIAFVAIIFLRAFLVQILMDLAFRLR